jgi:GH24 family phage-related lysozyme (muramidase)
MKMGADAVGAKRDGVPTREILEGSAKGFAVMWVTAAAFYEVGSALKDAGLSGSWVKIPVHGITAGLISAAAGGDPTDVRSAFMGAAFGAAGGFAAESFKFDNVGYRALVGAIAARIAGGDAAQGAAWAAAAYLFNELAHPMRTSSAGLQAIAGHEGFSPTIYQDQAGYDTIGYGHKLTAGEAGLYSNGITEEQGLALLRQDVRTAELAVNRLVNVSLSQSQFDALVSFTYNVGSGNFANSTLLQQLNSGNYAGAADQFLRWNRVTINGQSVVSDGLTNRRIAERCMFGGC